VPWIARERRSATALEPRVPENVFDAYKIFVTCQINDDVPYIVSCCGEDRLVIGANYGQTDPSSAVPRSTNSSAWKVGTEW